MNTDRVIITTEHPATGQIGGAGTYLEILESLLPVPPLILFVEPLKLEGLPQLIRPDMFFTADDLKGLSLQEVAYQCLLKVLMDRPHIRLVEYSEGLGAIIAQAKTCGLLPEKIITQVVCHGNLIPHIENLNRSWFGLDHLQEGLLEKTAIENSDCIIFPSRYLKEIYEDHGIRIAPEKTTIIGLPFQFDVNLPFPPYSEIDTLVFFGGQRSMRKGFPEFTEMLCRLEHTPEFCQKIRKIILLGPRNALMEKENRYVDDLSKKGLFHVEQYALPRHEALAMLKDLAPHALMVSPSRGESYGLTVPEMSNLGCTFLTADTGAAPEIVPQAFHSHVLFPMEPKAMAQKVLETLKIQPEKRQQLYHQLKTAMAEKQIQINQYYTAPIESSEETVAMAETSVSILVSVLDASMLTELCLSINSQTLLPEEVIFVLDKPENFDIELRCPWRIMDAESGNLKNAGLAAVNTPYVVTMDSDTILFPDYIHDFMRHVTKQPHLAVSICHSSQYRPFSDSLILGQIQNPTNESAMGFKTDILRQVGGWEGSDWALVLKLISHGYAIGFIPKINCHCPARPPLSWTEMRQLARSTTHLPRYDAFRLHAILQNLSEKPPFEKSRQVQRIFKTRLKPHVNLCVNFVKPFGFNIELS